MASLNGPVAHNNGNRCGVNQPFFHHWIQILKRTCQEANESLALYTVPCNFVTMVTTDYYVHCPLSLPSAFNNCIQQNTSSFFVCAVYYNGLYSEYMQRYGGKSGLFWNIGTDSKFSFLTTLTLWPWKWTFK